MSVKTKAPVNFDGCKPNAGSGRDGNFSGNKMKTPEASTVDV
jgi:hypothetical protein